VLHVCHSKVHFLAISIKLAILIYFNGALAILMIILMHFNFRFDFHFDSIYFNLSGSKRKSPISVKMRGSDFHKEKSVNHPEVMSQTF
jgi:hypothetical protein